MQTVPRSLFQWPTGTVCSVITLGVSSHRSALAPCGRSCGVGSTISVLDLLLCSNGTSGVEGSWNSWFAILGTLCL